MKPPSSKPALRRAVPIAVLGLLALATCKDARLAGDPVSITPLPEAATAWDPFPSDLWLAPPEQGRRIALLDTDPASGLPRTNLVGGWAARSSAANEAGIWSIGPRSILRFELDRAQPLWLELACAPYSYPGAPPQSVEVRVNGVALSSLALDTGFADYRIGVPAQLLRRGWNAVELDYARTTAPADVDPDSRDARELAVAFRRVALVAQRVARPVELSLESESTTRKGWLQTRSGSFSHLLALPAGARLALGWMVLGPQASPPIAARVELETDAGSEVLLDEHTGGSQVPTEREIDLSAHAGEATRLRFSIENLPDGARWIWLSPRILQRPGDTLEPGAPVLPGANVVIAVLDAAARDRLGLYGYDRGTTPNLDALAEESLVFESAHSQAAYTLASTASLFTSLHPARHGVVTQQQKLNPSLPTLASVLGAAGYATAAFSANGFASPVFGMETGFDSFRVLGGEDGWGSVAQPDELWRTFDGWLGELTSRERTRPFFAYLHYIQPHEPYDLAPDSFYDGLEADYRGAVDGSAGSMREIRRHDLVPTPAEVERLGRLYDGNLRYADAALGRVIERLRAGGLLEQSILVVTSDHGEAMGEGGFFGHNYSLQEEVTAIPLMIRFPKSAGLVGRVTEPAASIDIAPTLLAVLGVTAPAVFEGRNLLQGLQPSAPIPTRIVASISAHDEPAVALWFGDFKYIDDPHRGGRVLRRGPEWDTSENVVAASPVTFALLERARMAVQSPTAARAAPGETVLPRETREGLEALGYIVE